MPPQQAIDALRLLLSGNPAVNVLVASEPGQATILQRLNLRQDLASEFRSAAQAAEPGANVVLRPYDPGYTPEWNELAYIYIQAMKLLQVWWNRFRRCKRLRFSTN